MITPPLPELLRYVWLSRGDLPAGMNPDTREGRLEFLCWWILHGRDDFPVIAPLIPADAYDPLFLPGTDGTPPLATALWHFRSDLQIDVALNDSRLNAWLFVHGLDEHGLWPLVGAKVRDWLCQPTGPAGMIRLVRMIAELQGDLAALDDPALMDWWLFEGRDQFPALSGLIPPERYAPLFLPSADGPVPLAAAFWRRRSDLQAVLPLNDSRLNAWLFVHGLDEHGLWPLVGAKVRDWLCQPTGPAGMIRLVRMIAELQGDLAALDDPALMDWFLIHGLRELHLRPLLNDSALATLGAAFLDAMMRHRPDVRCDFGHDFPSGWWPVPPESGAVLCGRLLTDPRRGLAVWCLLHGLVKYGLEPLLTAGDREFLTTPMAPETAISPVMILAWHGRDDLRAAIDPATPAGRAQLAQWYENHAQAEISLAALLASHPPSPAAAVRSFRPHGVNLIGFARSELGIGEDVRCLALALEAAAVPHTIVSLTPRSNCRSGDHSLDRSVTNQRLYDTNVFCLTGFDAVWAYVRLGPDFFADSINIGNWPWELPAWPDSWSFALGLMDEFWAISRFCAECYGAATAKPVIWMPSAVRPLAPPVLGRAELGVPDGRFLFTVVFDFNSYLDRKNPLGVIDAFEEAFGIGGAPVLAVKVMNGDGTDPRWHDLLGRAGANPSIRLLEGTWPYDRVTALIAASDCFVSLHRAEGFGRGLAEAMILGVPVIATGWSGSTDLTADGRALTVDHVLVPVPPGAYPHGEGQVWAEPSIPHAAQRMRHAVANPEAIRAMADRARTHVSAQHSIAAAGERYRQRLEELWGAVG